MIRKKLNQNSYVYLGAGLSALIILIIGIVAINSANPTSKQDRSRSLNANVGITLHDKKKDNVDIEITKTISNATPCLNEQITYTITATNLDKKHKAKELKIQDILPGGLTLVSANATKGEYKQNTGIWELDKLKKKKSESLSLVATVGSAGTISNTATYLGSDNPDPNPSNDSATVSLTVDAGCTPPPPPPPPPPANDEADLSLIGSSEKSEVKHGEHNKFTFKIKNKSKKKATNIKVRGAFHKDLSLLQALATKGTFDQANYEWGIPDLAGNEEEKLELTFEIKTTAPDTTLQNDVDIVSADQADPNTGDNQSQVILAVTGADPLPSSLLPTQSTPTATVTTPPQTSATSFSAESRGQEPSQKLTDNVDAAGNPQAATPTTKLLKDKTGPRQQPNATGRNPLIVVRVECPSCNIFAFAALLVLLIVAALVVTSCLIHWSYLRPIEPRPNGSKPTKPANSKSTKSKLKK